VGHDRKRAWIDRHIITVVRPGHFLVQSVSALALDQGEVGSFALDVSQVRLPSDGRLIEVPLLAGLEFLLASRRARYHTTWRRRASGSPASRWPSGVIRLVLRASTRASSRCRRGPGGGPGGDRSGDSTPLLQAKAALESYRTRAF
jgi:hypothetical protein